MKHTLITIAGITLLLSACIAVDDAVGSTIGGSVLLESVVDTAQPFYDTTSRQHLIDARLVESEPLGSFEPTPQQESVVAGSVIPIGRFLPPRVESLPDVGALEVGTWTAIDPDNDVTYSCFGYHNGDYQSGSRCSAEGEETEMLEAVVYWELSCQEGGQDRWIAFTADPAIVALRFDLRDDVSVVGHDPTGTGLVAVEGIGELTAATAQTRTGDVWLVDIVGAACPVG